MAHLIDTEVDLLKQEFESMGAMVLNIVRAAAGTVESGWNPELEEAIQLDRDVDARENTIDRHCAKLCVTQSPVAHDMRLMFCTIRSAAELERMGDHAKEVCRCLKRAGAGVALNLHPLIETAAAEVASLLDDALTAQRAEDVAKVRDVLAKAKAGKDSFKTWHEETVGLFDAGEHSNAVIMEVVSVGHHMKRIYGYIGNLCKNSVYLLEGEIVRHHGAELPLEQTPGS